MTKVKNISRIMFYLFLLLFSGTCFLVTFSHAGNSTNVILTGYARVNGNLIVDWSHGTNPPAVGTLIRYSNPVEMSFGVGSPNNILTLNISYEFTIEGFEIDYYQIEYYYGGELHHVDTIDEQTATVVFGGLGDDLRPVVIQIITRVKRTERYTLTVSSPGSGNGGETDSDGTISDIVGGTNFTITATAESGFEFSGFEVDGVLFEVNPIDLTIYENTTVAATFGPLPVNIESEINPSFLYLNKKGTDKLTIQSKPEIELPVLNSSQVIQIQIIFKGLGINGGDLILKSNFNADVLENGQVIQYK